MPIYNGIINQKGTPAFYSDIFANRPAFGYAGRVFISTDTGAIYEDTGTAWTLIADAGAGTTGTLQQVTTNGNTTTLGIVVQGININDGAGTGGSNVAIGSGLQNNTTGSANTSLGLNSLTANTTANNNTAIGNNSLQLNTTGANNTSIGSNSLSANTTASFNTAIGASSLNINTTGANNTALGNTSLASNTTASFNTAIGATSLQLNTTGASNTAVGYQSLNANTTGASNTAIGVSALSGNTTATGNTAIGSSSLQNNTTGASNTAIGLNSLRSNTNGQYNVAVGAISLDANTTGINNTAIGYGALQYVTIGGSNVAVGYGSGSAITTGNNNSLLGGGQAITTGSNNTIIGAYGGFTTLANNIVLSDGQANVRLFSDANGLIGINQAVGSTIGGQLDIHTTQTYALVLNGLTTSNAYTAFSNNSVGKWRIGNTYNAGANSFDIFNLGTSSTALSINSTSNNIGIGTITPATKLQVNGNITFGTSHFIGDNVFNSLLIQSSAGENILLDSQDDILLQTNGTSKLIIKNTGNVGIGITPVAKFMVNVAANQELRVSQEASQLAIYSVNDAANAFNILSIDASTLQLNSQSSGNVLIGTTTNTNSSKLVLYGGASTNTLDCVHTGTADTFCVIFTNDNGLVGSIRTSGTTTSYNVTSDYRLKQDFKNYSGLNLVSAIKTYDYEWKSDKSRMYGVLAHELQKVLPYAVSGEKDGKIMQQVDYSKIVPVLIKAIQELKLEIDTLKNK